MQAKEPKQDQPKPVKLNRATRRRLGMIKKPTATQILVQHFAEQRQALFVPPEATQSPETYGYTLSVAQNLRNRQKRIRQGR